VEKKLPSHLKQDKQLPEKLAGEYSGILAWGVRGCLEWQRDGMRTPAEVEAATTEYRNEQEVLAEFLEERCLVGPPYRASSADLYGVYKLWCSETGESNKGRRKFGRNMSERPNIERYTANGTKYRGVAPRIEWLEKVELQKVAEKMKES